MIVLSFPLWDIFSVYTRVQDRPCDCTASKEIFSRINLEIFLFRWVAVTPLKAEVQQSVVCQPGFDLFFFLLSPNLTPISLFQCSIWPNPSCSISMLLSDLSSQLLCSGGAEQSNTFSAVTPPPLFLKIAFLQRLSCTLGKLLAVF